MSLLFTYLSGTKAIMASDDRVSGSPKDVFPKFQVLRTNASLPIFCGAVGLRGPVQHLFSVLPRMLRETGFELATLQDFLPGAIAHMLRKRDPSTVDAARDVIYPPVQLLLAGFDAGTRRLRAWLTLATGQGTGVVHELAQHDFAAIGFLAPEDDARLTKFTASIKENAPRHDATWIARELAREMSDVAAVHAGEIGPPSYFAALDGLGAPIALPAACLSVQSSLRRPELPIRSGTEMAGAERRAASSRS